MCIFNCFLWFLFVVVRSDDSPARWSLWRCFRRGRGIARLWLGRRFTVLRSCFGILNLGRLLSELPASLGAGGRCSARSNRSNGRFRYSTATFCRPSGQTTVWGSARSCPSDPSLLTVPKFPRNDFSWSLRWPTSAERYSSVRPPKTVPYVLIQASCLRALWPVWRQLPCLSGDCYLWCHSEGFRWGRCSMDLGRCCSWGFSPVIGSCLSSCLCCAPAIFIWIAWVFWFEGWSGSRVAVWHLSSGRNSSYCRVPNLFSCLFLTAFKQ